MTPMGLLNIFRSRPPIREPRELAQFIDENAAFLVQKGIYEYSRARAGHYAKVLFREPEFAQALEHSRWSAYPLGLAMVGELVEGVLRPAARFGSTPAAGVRCERSFSRSSTATLLPRCSTRAVGVRAAPSLRASCS